MTTLENECAAMAAEMLDAELVVIIRRYPGEPATALQKAVKAEASRRGLSVRDAGRPGDGRETDVGVDPGVEP